MDNIQQFADTVQKGLQLIVRASVQQGSTGLRRLRIELCSDSFHAVRELRAGQMSMLYNNGDGCCLLPVIFRKTSIIIFLFLLKRNYKSPMLD